MEGAGGNGLLLLATGAGGAARMNELNVRTGLSIPLDGEEHTMYCLTVRGICFRYSDIPSMVRGGGESGPNTQVGINVAA